jgi:hypothetical protein
MRECEEVRLAQALAEKLNSVKRNDWLRWARMWGGDLEAGLRWAREMGRDPNLSESTRRAMEQIARGVMALREDLERLSPLERLRVFGWVARLLRIREHESFSTPARRR